MNKEYYFHNTVFTHTDSFGSWNEESVPLGLVNYGNKELGHYFSFDEIEKLLDSGFEDDNIVKYENSFRLSSSYCSSCTCFSIHCGKVLHETKYTNLLEYAKKIGLVHDNFVPVKGWKGTKTMEEVNEGIFNVYYKIDEPKENHIDTGFVEKVCIGSIKKLAGQRVNCYRGNGCEIELKFVCDNVIFDNETLTLKILGIPLKYVNNDFTSTLKRLDLELWMIYNKDKHWSRFFYAAIQLVADRGQEHWLNGLEKIKSNYDWYDIPLGETFDNN